MAGMASLLLSFLGGVGDGGRCGLGEEISGPLCLDVVKGAVSELIAEGRESSINVASIMIFGGVALCRYCGIRPGNCRHNPSTSTVVRASLSAPVLP